MKDLLPALARKLAPPFAFVVLLVWVVFKDASASGRGALCNSICYNRLNPPLERLAMPLGPAQRLSEAFRYLDPRKPLREAWFEIFHVPRPDRARLQDLRDYLDLSEEEAFVKILFTGPRGSGKSTELYLLSRMLEQTHFIVSVPGERIFEFADVSYQDVFVAMGLAVYEAAVQAGLSSPDVEEAAWGLRYWYEERVVEEESSDQITTTQIRARISFLEWGREWQSSPTWRERVRRITETRLSDLLTRLNHLLRMLHQALGKRLLILFDDLDKIYDLDQARNLFLNQALLKPEAQIIYTVPIALIHRPDFQQARLSFDKTIILPNIAAFTLEGQPYELGRRFLRALLLKRMAQGLITPEALERLVTLSGGVLRELVGRARDAILRARRRAGDHGPIDVTDVEVVIQEVANTFRRTLHRNDYPALQQILETKSIQDLEPIVVARLLHGMAVLEYNDKGRNWWDVHPVVKILLSEDLS